MPAKAEDLLRLLIRERQKRVRTINLKRKVRQALGGRRKKTLPQEQAERR